MTMNCQEVQDQLHPYLDGELEPSLAQHVERALEDCPECRAELNELKALRLMAQAALEGPVAEVDLSHMVGDVMQRLESEGALRVQSEPARREEKANFGAWLSSLFSFEQPLVSLAALALVLVAVAAIAFNAEPQGEATGPQIASPAAESEAPTESVATSAPALPAVERLSGAAAAPRPPARAAATSPTTEEDARRREVGVRVGRQGKNRRRAPHTARARTRSRPSRWRS